MRENELLRLMRTTNKSFFTIADLEKITGMERKSLYVTLNRLVKRGVLERAARNVYIIAGEPTRVEAVAGQVYFPSYFSFESALSRFGILNLVPYTFTFATTRKTKKLTLLGRSIDYRHIREELFFGFELKDGMYLAEPEKAFLDLVYFSTFGKGSLPAEEMDLRSLSRQKLDKYSKRFPRRVSGAVARMLYPDED
jgi:predicted transcriptional regulator of viral defense system